jgi:hypothetical protein
MTLFLQCFQEYWMDYSSFCADHPYGLSIFCHWTQGSCLLYYNYYLLLLDDSSLTITESSFLLAIPMPLDIIG